MQSSSSAVLTALPHHKYDTNYGLSESIGPGCVHLGVDNIEKIGAIGKAGYLWQTRILDERGNDVAPGEIGELAVKGPGVMKCYYKNPEATAEILHGDWLWTGDMAREDKDGFIYLVDRKKDVIISGGENLYPVQIEDFLRRNEKIKDVVLVDHNEAAQSVPGLEQAEIVEIIDHHRLADIQTGGPIYFRNEPVGSTATIISEMYQERGLMPPAKLAGLIAAAIVADTVMFKSPTSTAVDRRMADRMARIANVSLDELGKTIFSASISDDKPADALLFTDFKDFHIADHDFGVSQITCVDSERMMERKDEFLSVMQKTMDERGYTLMILMLTDVLLEGTHLLYLGDEDIITQAFGVKLKDHTCFLPGVVSRKKQVIPMLTALWG